MKETDLIIERIQDLKDSHSKRLDNIDQNLNDHMKRTKNVEDRVEKLELPIKLLNLFKSSILYIGTIIGLVLSVIKLKEIL